MTIREENNQAWAEAMAELESLELGAVVASMPEQDHGPLPRFRIRWAEDIHSDREIRAQEKAMKALARLLKKDRMEIHHTDDEGFQVYCSRASEARKSSRGRRPRV